jgi:succinate dehydrogenase / fumarate reductase flavoprotein subunit
MDPYWRKVNLVCSVKDGELEVEKKPLPSMTNDLQSLFDEAELGKYMTAAELETAGQG